ncbi:MAG: DMT family transporter [Bacteroidetes bacterium]|nr:DMT family transporter [Bacteroidota bacterium]
MKAAGHSSINTAILAIISCLLWSSAFAGVKIGLQYTTPLQFAGIRFFIAGLIVFPFALRNNPRYFKILRNNLGMILFFAFLQTFLQYVMFYTGISMIPSAVAAIVIGSQPLFVAVVAHFLMPGDRLTLLKTSVILSGILGVILVSMGKDPYSVTGTIALAGILLMVGINILSGFTNVLVARESNMIPPLVISSASMTIGGAALFLFSLPIEGLHFEAKPAPYYISLLWLSLLSAFAISIWITLLKRPGIKVSDLNLWKFLIPLFGAILSWLLIPGENPEAFSITGMAVIALSLLALNLVNRKKHAIIQEKT